MIIAEAPWWVIQPIGHGMTGGDLLVVLVLAIVFYLLSKAIT